MKKLITFPPGRFLITIVLACTIALSSLGGAGALEMGASTISSALRTKYDDQTVTSAKDSLYNDTDRAWTYKGHWSVYKTRRALKGQLHSSSVVGDYVTISIKASRFTLIYSKAPNYGKVAIYVDGQKIQTISQNSARASYQKEWTSPELGPGTHRLKFVHATGKNVNIDALRVRDSNSIPSLTPTGIPPTLALSPSPTNTIPDQSPTVTLLPEATASPVPSLVPSLTANPTRTQVPSPTPTKSFTATLTAALTFTPAPSIGTQVYYVSPNGSDTNPGNQTQPLRTIQKAVTLASAGATIRVLAGTYPEAITLTKSNISLIAEPKVYMKGFSIKGSNNLVRGFIIANTPTNAGIEVYGNNNVIEKNDISNARQDGIWFFGSGNRFVGNYIHDIVDRSKITSDPHVDCFQTWGPAENIVFEKNICNHTSTYGSNQIVMLENINPPVRNITFRNNIFIMHDPGPSPINFHRKAGQGVISDLYVINNTFVHKNGIGFNGVALTAITNASVVNNIFIDYGDQKNSYVLVKGGSTGIKISNNAVYKSDNIAPMGGPYPGDIWMQNLRLANLSGGDFHLTASSPLINKGAAVSSVKDDLDGRTRPIGAGYDIGAYEYPTAP